MRNIIFVLNLLLYSYEKSIYKYYPLFVSVRGNFPFQKPSNLAAPEVEEATSKLQNSSTPVAYLRHTYAYFTTITHPSRFPNSPLRVQLFIEEVSGERSETAFWSSLKETLKPFKKLRQHAYRVDHRTTPFGENSRGIGALPSQVHQARHSCRASPVGS